MKLTREELQAIWFAGGRSSGEKSNAQESWKYRNPADTAKFPAEIERGRKLKSAKKAKKRRK